MKVDKKAVGLRIKQLRLNKGYTLEEFGKLFGASKGNIQQWENGKSLPNKDRIKQISKLADITVNELLYGTIDSYTKTQALKEGEELLVKLKKLSKIADIDLADHYEAIYNQWLLEYSRERMKENDGK